jgi:hypothetical protein
MTLRAAIALLAVLGLGTACSPERPVIVGPCHRDTVQTSPGLILSLSSSQTYQVFPTDNHISMTWLPMDRLIVCPIGGAAVEMTNSTKKGAKIRALRIFNLNWYVQPY